jgi:phosphatidate phosphatase APP1
VLSLKKMFRNAFKEEYKPVPGMPELFRRIHDLFPNVTRELHKRANNNHQHHRNPTRSHKKKHKKKKSATRSLPPSNATAVSNATTQQISLRPLTQKQQTPLFYYVSGTPWQLTDVLSHFIDQYYPMGEFMLQKFRFSIGSLIRLSNIRKYKTGRFDLIHKRFPELRWYLIGDSGQLDPEIYAEIYKRYPDRIICIWIVKTQGTDEKKERKQNSDSRFQKVFKEVPSDKWNAFHEPATIMQLPEGKCR